MLPTPKQHKANRWFHYYAGYSEDFLNAALRRLIPNQTDTSCVLDPWNGAGTTSSVLALQRYKGFGFDLNPTLVLAAKAKLLQPETAPSITPLLEEILLSARINQVAVDNDLFSYWFNACTARSIRSIEQAIDRLLISPHGHSDFAQASTTDLVSPLASFYYVALFRTIRSFLTPFKTTNPTWIKVARHRNECIDVPNTSVEDLFRSTAHTMVKEWSGLPKDFLDHPSTLQTLGIADSCKLPLPDASIDAVLTSPPYCTRIDYFRATLPELATLYRTNRHEFSSLRTSLIGSTAAPATPPASLPSHWPSQCRSLLQSVLNHPSKASKTYYYRYFYNYFSKIDQSLIELTRVTKPKAQACVVVQDSYYKNIHIDLDAIFKAFFKTHNWKATETFTYTSGTSLSMYNQYSRNYRKSATPTESAIFLEKGAA